MALINAKKRDTEMNPRQVRAVGLVTATVYGNGMDSISIQTDVKEFYTAYRKDKNAVFEIKMETETHKAIVKKVQIDAVSDKVLNVEFQRIQSDKKIKIRVPFETVGDSAAVKAGGKLKLNLSSVMAECLPADIPSTIQIDISKLADYGDSLTVGQIEFPKGVRPIGSVDNVAVKIAAPKAVKGS